jgi:hypothetical protein
VNRHTNRQAGDIEGSHNGGGTLGETVEITAQIMRHVGAGEGGRGHGNSLRVMRFQREGGMGCQPEK